MEPKRIDDCDEWKYLSKNKKYHGFEILNNYVWVINRLQAGKTTTLLLSYEAIDRGRNVVYDLQLCHLLLQGNMQLVAIGGNNVNSEL